MVDAAAAGTRLDVFLAARVAGISRTQLGRQTTDGAVTVNGISCAPSRKMKRDDVVLWTQPEARPVELAAEAIPLRVVHEDRWLIVIDKPPGMVVHPAAGHSGGTLVNALLAHCGDLRGIGGELRPGIVHRLDKDTSGLMVAAKDDATMAALGADFKVHNVARTYDALVTKLPVGDSGVIDTLHGRDPRHRKKFTTLVKTGRRAVTRWRLAERLGTAARLEATLETGRTHQVRVHLASVGCPILGDQLYGRSPRDEDVRDIGRALGRQALHARKLGFRHPATGQWLEWDAPPPADFQRALVALRALGGGA